MKTVKTEKDYRKHNFKLNFAVITDKGVVMSKGFTNKKDAEDFRDNAYCGYYRGCTVKLINM